ncbi:hypothetical protein GCM10022225_27110 [Plantactinospora mayteni]|uniref:Uncharacterized protein n=1 Tax=Plantactinospora mayteni TaxID=566021 RepID=A0ABQ4EIM5_9ACTN|nr:hypothetical protein Pma05_11320 [Plantactinospora mayteni]
MRARFAPEGVATGKVWTANVLTFRHVIEGRTAAGAEEKIRLLFGKIGELMGQGSAGPIRRLHRPGRRMDPGLAEGLTQAKRVDQKASCVSTPPSRRSRLRSTRIRA